MEISRADWSEYVRKLSAIDSKAASLMEEYITSHGYDDPDALVRYAHALATKYGEASGALACEMYDEVAAAQGAMVPPAVPAETATFGETAKAIRGTWNVSPVSVPDTTGRLVKQAGADTILKNAERDGAQFAWVPGGDTCVFCMTIASRGWQYMSKNALKGGHAEHIHANCDCTYAVRFDGESSVKGYDPDKYKAMYDAAEGSNSREKINSMRREQYAENKDRINAQKRMRYARIKPQKAKRFPVTQNQIDDIIKNELSDFEIIKHPVYNARLRSQGKTTAELYPWGEVKKIVKIEIGPQSKETKECLIDTIIHEQLEAKIMVESNKDAFYHKLHEMSESDRHNYINSAIKEHFDKKGWNYGLV